MTPSENGGFSTAIGGGRTAVDAVDAGNDVGWIFCLLDQSKRRGENGAVY